MIEAQTSYARARAYVEKMPPAISGTGGHNATFAVAVALIHGFALPEAEAWPILCEYNTRSRPPWSELELRHKLISAGKLTRTCKPKGHLLKGKAPQQNHVPVPPKPEHIIWQVEPEPLPNKRERDEGEPKHVSEPDTTEASRIAGELVKLYEAGAISGPDDPEAVFYACIIHQFGGTVITN